ncbi:Beta-hexosaminidase [Mycena sanguinolenta]|uniref:beta-N-acetylhexosaminidase n=1 Tax=Mycena sanguinolenta TaxID=230812 RepID=A0A8H7CS05_9AGAR|nr:Beta-hexosaminidase [Mycena sanguinolenta]
MSHPRLCSPFQKSPAFSSTRDSRIPSMKRVQRLSPPTLLAFAHTFAADLVEIGLKELPVEAASAAQPNSVFLTISSDGMFLDAAGRHTSEGYTLTVGSEGVVIAGASPLGAWWGTRTLMQQAKLGDLELPVGSGSDAPGWGTRGVMLDAGRHYYPPDFLTQICAYLSFFKQNTFHLHLSDNLFNNVDIYSRERTLDLYAAFRLNSDEPGVAGLVRPYRFNESYTRETFDGIQSECAARGVTIIPEIEAPGHALVISQWKPELGLADLSLLNISFPETIPTMKTIWSTFLPWFHSKTVHIGADEYDSTLADDYILFVNTFSSFIQSESGKDIRIWGTNEPSNTSVVSRNITIQHWEFFEDNPFDLIKQGYNVLNSGRRVLHRNPAGGAYAPYVFDTNNATNNPPRDDARVVGHIAAQWNDYGPNATVVSEAYYAWRDALPALADKQWGGVLTRAQYDTVFEDLRSVVPGQNLDNAIASKTDVILQYNFASTNGETITDSSGNGYDGTCVGCSISNGVVTFSGPSSRLTTPLTSKGRNYTLSFSINPSSKAPLGAPIFSGPDSTLVLGNGTLPNLALVSGGNLYALNYTLPRDVVTDVALIGRGNATFLRGGRRRGNGVFDDSGRERGHIGGDGFLGSVGKVELLGTTKKRKVRQLRHTLPVLALCDDVYFEPRIASSSMATLEVVPDQLIPARSLWLAAGLPVQSLSRLNLSSHPDSAINSSFKLGSIAQTAIGVSGLSAAHFHFLRTGVDQEITVDARHAVLEFYSEAWHTVDGSLSAPIWDDIAGIYRTKDGHVRIHTNFPHHRLGILSILEIPDAEATRARVQSALDTWNAVELETEAAAKGMCATALRSYAEWSLHPHAKALEGAMRRKREICGDFARPLEGIRMCDLSRVLAGPVAGRTLADVLLITSPAPAQPTKPGHHEKLKQLAATADVFLQAYRPGGLQAKGFGPQELAALRPGIVTANLTAWGWEGPWKDRRGFDSLVQTATGFNVAEGAAFAEFAGGEKEPLQPRPLPMPALDYAAGYLLAFGINAALCKTVTEGGSWEVRVSLAAVGQWIRSLGQLAPEGAFGPAAKPFPSRVLPLDPEIAALSLPWKSGSGRQMTALKHPAILSRTPVREGEESQAPMALNAHPAEWL